MTIEILNLVKSLASSYALHQISSGITYYRKIGWLVCLRGWWWWRTTTTTTTNWRWRRWGWNIDWRWRRRSWNISTVS